MVRRLLLRLGRLLPDHSTADLNHHPTDRDRVIDGVDCPPTLGRTPPPGASPSRAASRTEHVVRLGQRGHELVDLSEV